MDGKRVGFLLLMLLLMLVGCNNQLALETRPVVEREEEARIVSTPTPDPIAIVKSGLESFEEEHVLYFPQDEMVVGEPTEIQASIVGDVKESLLPPEVIDAIYQGIEPRPQISTIFATVRLASNAKDFSIRPIGSESQIVAGDVTTWHWEVVPARAGKKKLPLVVTLKIDIPGITTADTDVKPIDREVRVRSNVTYSAVKFVSERPEVVLTVVTVLLVPGLGYVWQRYQSRKNGAKKLEE